MTRITSMDPGYLAGDLSVFPNAIDSTDTLYRVENGAITNLKHGLPYTGTFVIVDDATAFPPQGIIRIGPLANTLSLNNSNLANVFSTGGATPGNAEMIYYGSRTSNTFQNLIRGFAGSITEQWPSGTQVANSVFAEVHNAVKDAVINTEKYIGTATNPAIGSINQMLQNQESRFLTPSASFRSFPLLGAPPLTVTFQNLSSGNVVRYFWDFGDQTTSFEQNPSHTYTREGIYTVTLNIITDTGALATATKANYITVSLDDSISFFYFEPVNPNQPMYSIDTAAEMDAVAGQDLYSAAVINFVDQSLGKIEQRIWSFGDALNTTVPIDDPNVHTINYTYQSAGTFKPSLLVIYEDAIYRKIYSQEITIL